MGRTAQRRQANSANRRINQSRGINAAAWFYGQSFHQSATEAARTLTTYPACKREVFTLVQGYCSRECRPAEGKNLQEMTDTQINERHVCGVKNLQHVDGWDGSWIDCAEAKRRSGL